MAMLNTYTRRAIRGASGLYAQSETPTTRRITTREFVDLGTVTQVERGEWYAGGATHPTLAAAAESLRPSAPAVDYSWADPSPEAQALAARFAGVPQTNFRAFIEGRTTGEAPAVLAHYQGEVEAALEAVADELPRAMTEWVANVQDQQVLTVIDWAQRMRQALTALEGAAVELARQDARLERQGTMADGRRYVLKRGQNRTQWAHDDWQRDVRQMIVRQVYPAGAPLALVNTDTGDVVDENPIPTVYGLLASAQRVHSSAGPKVTALAGLDLAADDYCHTEPGRWSVQFIDTPTTTED